MTNYDLDALLGQCLKPDEISNDETRAARVNELIHWFTRYARHQANPKWLHGHAFELAYALALTSDAPVSTPPRAGADR